MLERTAGARSAGRLPLLAAVGLALAIGMAVPFYVVAMDGSVGRLLVLPAVIVLMTVYFVDKFLLLTGILLFRSAGDLLFDSTKFGIGGISIGLGGLINIAIIGIVVSLLLEGRRFAAIRQQFIWWMLLLSFVAGVFYAPDRSSGLRSLLAVCSYFSVFIAAFFYVSRYGGIRQCLNITLASSFIPVLYGLFQLAVVGVGSSRLSGTFAHPNIFAFYLVTISMVLLYMIKSDGYFREPWQRRLVLAYFLIVMFLLLMTQTRSAWLACFTMFAIYALIFERKYIVYICIAPVIALMIPGVQERLMDLGQGNEVVQYARLNSFAWRKLIWTEGLRWIEPSRYLFGYGVGAFTFYSPVFFSMSGEVNAGAHNVYVEMFFNLGAFGLIAYVGLMLAIGKSLFSLRKDDRLLSLVLILIVVQYAVISMSDNMLGYLSYNWYVFFLLGAGVALVRERARERCGERIRSDDGKSIVGRP